MAEDTFSRTAQPSDAAPNVEKIREKCATSVKLGYIYIASMSFMELIKLHWLKYRQLKTICTQIIQKKIIPRDTDSVKLVKLCTSHLKFSHLPY